MNRPLVEQGIRPFFSPNREPVHRLGSSRLGEEHGLLKRGAGDESEARVGDDGNGYRARALSS